MTFHYDTEERGAGWCQPCQVPIRTADEWAEHQHPRPADLSHLRTFARN